MQRKLINDLLQIIRWNSTININDIDQFICQIQTEEFNINTPEKFNYCIRALPDYYIGPNNEINFFVAINTNELVGSIGLKDLGNHNAELRKFYIHKNFRNIGLSAKIFNCILEAARQDSFENIFTATMPEKIKAQQFYEKLGFTKITEIELPKEFIVQKLDKLFYRYKIV